MSRLHVFSLFTAMFLCILAPAQESSQPRSAGERHTGSDPGSALYQRSIFAHGFIHGYEQGFHVADLDYHEGHTDRKLKEIRDYRNASSGYHSNFGDKDTFRQGYREGFTQGYDDSIHSRSFRAVMAASVVAGNLKGYAGSSKELDAGFAAGYLAEHANPQNLSVCQAGSSFDYCNGFALGAEFAAISSGTSPVIAKARLDAFAIK
jgi:hypothetical protein